jgi:hypothetical protein
MGWRSPNRHLRCYGERAPHQSLNVVLSWVFPPHSTSIFLSGGAFTIRERRLLKKFLIQTFTRFRNRVEKSVFLAYEALQTRPNIFLSSKMNFPIVPGCLVIRTHPARNHRELPFLRTQSLLQAPFPFLAVRSHPR